MDVTKLLLEQAYTNMLVVKESYSQELSKAPAGTLRKASSRGKTLYRQAICVDGTITETGLNRNQALLFALARKAFLQKSLQLIEKNISAIERCIKHYEEADPKTVVGLMSGVYAELPPEAFCRSAYGLACLHGDDDIQARIERHRDWAREPYVKSSRECSSNYVAMDGTMMRSKNELLVAEKLREYGIAYKYEKELALEGIVIHPDFTVQKKNLQEMYIEVCGMMDSTRYRENFKERRDLYERNGIADWNNNIAYLCFNGNELDLQQLDFWVQYYVVPQV